MKRPSRSALRRIVAEILRNADSAVPSTIDVAPEIDGAKIAASVCKVAGAIAPRPPARIADLLVDLLLSPDPAGAMVNFRRFVDRAGASAAFLETVAGGRPVREIIATVFGSSQYMSDIIIRNPGYLYWLMEKRTWEREESESNCEEDLRSEVSRFDTPDGKLDSARRFQRRMLLKIGVKDLLGIHTIEETTAALSNLAVAVVRVVLDVVRRDIADGAEETPGFAVIALGKLGGSELNYSSDIDLVFVCEDVGDERFQSCHMLGRRLASALSEVTGEGYLYRVDLRLRPDGATGPLVNTLTAMRVYYENRGRPWEFQAMLKARAIAGDETVGGTFLRHIEGLVFNPSLPYSPVEDIAAMRVRIRNNIPLRERTFNIKLMEGGIRDIEFIVQTLQLLHGAAHRGIRRTNTLAGLRAAYAKKLIKRAQYRTLDTAYRFFRLVEHRLQMMHQVKTHSIPRSGAEIALLARRVSKGSQGKYTHDSFLSALTSHINNVRLLSDSFFAGTDVSESAMSLLMPGNDDYARETLEQLGFDDPAGSVSMLRSLAYGSFPNLVDRRTRDAFQRFLFPFLEELSEAPLPDAALVNLVRVARASRNAAALYEFLARSAPPRHLLRDLLGTSSVLIGKLHERIDIMEWLAGGAGAAFEAPISSEPGVRRFIDSLSSQSRTSEARSVTPSVDPRIASSWFADIRRRTFPTELARTQTRIMRELLQAAFEAVAAEREGVALFAMGSYAVGEPRLGSDVDLLAVTKDADVESITRKLQKLNRVFSENNLARLDFRLRGEGANAPLVQDISFYETYFDSRMSAWERVAFSRCAHWSGDAGLAAEFAGMLAPQLTAASRPDVLADLARTRRQLEALVTEAAVPIETKRSPGGRYDIDYLCTAGLARLESPYPLDAATEDRLRMLADGGVISSAQLAALNDAVVFYARIDYLLELQSFNLPDTRARTDELVRYLARAFRLLGFCAEHEFTERLAQLRTTVRRCYDGVVTPA